MESINHKELTIEERLVFMLNKAWEWGTPTPDITIPRNQFMELKAALGSRACSDQLAETIYCLHYAAIIRPTED